MTYALREPFASESVGGRWATHPVWRKTLEQAEADAKRSSEDAFHVNVWDCTSGPVGVLVCKYVRGERVSP